MPNNGDKIYGVLARFDGPQSLFHAAEKIRDAGYEKYDCHSPFPIHGMDRAMGLKRSPIGWLAGLLAALGGGGFFGLQWWTSAVNYPLVISGKPYFSFQAFVPITFAGPVIGAAFAAVLGMLIINQLPRLNHPLFNSDTFNVSDDGFFVSIKAGDRKFDREKVAAFLKSIGAEEVEVISQ